MFTLQMIEDAFHAACSTVVNSVQINKKSKNAVYISPGKLGKSRRYGGVA